MRSVEERIVALEIMVPEMRADTRECKEGIIRIEEKLHIIIKEVSYVRGAFKIATAVFVAGLGLFAAKIKSWIFPG